MEGRRARKSATDKVEGMRGKMGGGSEDRRRGSSRRHQ